MQKSANRLIAKIAGIFVLPPLLIIGLIIWAGNILDPLPPTIKHGEFPFELKYEMNGKKYDVSDTVVCDFSNISTDAGGFGKIRRWNEHLKSGTRRITILSDINIRSIIKPDRIDSEIEIYYNYGSATYFMGDPDGSVSEKPQIEYIETYSERPNVIVTDATPLSAEQLQTNFGIKIINYSDSPPIKNTFK
ncbi:hypothetical protein [Paenibacillus sp. A3M_27_13]|uniref:hypothetical protein n=1 Tax=Paenibacillus sp. A3M_27_13 TaxID=2962029 RepID=UPI0020B6840D|nr:hypothetical protein [Paenibacillus sp. A3M_27_13]MCP3746710.1 hypothetical protein [Paenibacillus sp. A3M_27_13]